MLAWTQVEAARSRGIMIWFLGKASHPAGVFHWRMVLDVLFACFAMVANVKCALGLGGFLEAAPIYSNGVAGGWRRYSARLGGGGSL